MKSFLAVALAKLPRFLEGRLRTPLHLLISYDEEVGCLGIRPLLAHLREKPVKPRLAIVGEPTEMRVVTAHKGKASWRCRVRGHECHSSIAPEGVNAVEYAARLVVRLNELARKKAKAGPFDPAFDVPFSTLHTGVISGGTALNIVPRDCHFDFEFRFLPAESAERLFAEVRDYALEILLPEMRAVAPQSDIAFDPLPSFVGLETPPDHEVVTLAKALAGANATSKVAFGTEAGLIAEAGIPAVVCGPGSIGEAHKPDEFIALEQVALCERFLDRLRERLIAA